jgi:uncharacterized repeat protein (TIGR03803 family)
MRPRKYSCLLCVFVTGFLFSQAYSGSGSAAAQSAFPSVPRVNEIVTMYPGSAGYNPWGALVADPAGNLYGTTRDGGTSGCGGIGCGTIFKLSNTGSGWEYTVIYIFTGGSDGEGPFGKLTLDEQGNLYGTTNGGGLTCGCGTVFELSPGNGVWTETTLYEFEGGTDGSSSRSNLVFDSSGNLYGTTESGGYFGYGTLFKLIPQPGGSWTERILVNFNLDDRGCFPQGIAIDSQNNIYGINTRCGIGGMGGGGTSWEFANTGAFTVLHQFQDGSGGTFPTVGLQVDSGGNVYGATELGGNVTQCANSGCGVVYELTPIIGGQWTETVLHTFDGNDGDIPNGDVTFGPGGDLYGTTEYAGTESCGTLWKVHFTSQGNAVFTSLYTFALGYGPPEAGIVFDSKGHGYGTQSWAPSIDGGIYEFIP